MYKLTQLQSSSFTKTDKARMEIIVANELYRLEELWGSTSSPTIAKMCKGQIAELISIKKKLHAE